MIREAVYYINGHSKMSSRKLSDTVVVSGRKVDQSIENVPNEPSSPDETNISIDALHLLYIKATNNMFPELEYILPGLLARYTKPVWCEVNGAVSSCMGLLPGISPFPLTHASVSWLCGGKSGFMVCRTLVGKWIIVDAKTLLCAQENEQCSNMLSKLVSTINCFPSRGSGTVCFDETRAYFVEADFCEDKLFVYCYDQSSQSLKHVCSIQSLPPGAVHVYGVHECRLIYSVGADIHIADLRETDSADELIIIESALACLQRCESEVKLPVSIQHVAPFVSTKGDVYYLSNGNLWKQSVNKQSPVCFGQPIFSHPYVSFVSISVCVSRGVLALFGADSCGNFYISLFDFIGQFVLSTKQVMFGGTKTCLLSVVAITIDPVSLDVTVIGRQKNSGACSMVTTYQPVYN